VSVTGVLGTNAIVDVFRPWSDGIPNIGDLVQHAVGLVACGHMNGRLVGKGVDEDDRS